MLVINPRATRVGQRVVERVRTALDARFDVDLVATAAPGEAAELCRSAGPDVGAVAVLGGDGTVNEAANGLAGGTVPLACLPGGLTNVFARALGVGRDPVAAAQRLAAGQGEVRSIDLGSVSGRAFLFASGLGLSAALTRRQAGGPRRPTGLVEAWALLAAARAVAAEVGRAPRLRVSSGGISVEGTTVVFQNTAPLTYLRGRPLHVSEGAGLQTGSLSAMVLRGAGLGELLSLTPKVLSGRPGAVAANDRVASLPGILTASVEALDGGTVSLEADGEYLGERVRVDYSVLPAALRVVA